MPGQVRSLYPDEVLKTVRRFANSMPRGALKAQSYVASAERTVVKRIGEGRSQAELNRLRAEVVACGGGVFDAAEWASLGDRCSLGEAS
jgi:hypothetical protein